MTTIFFALFAAAAISASLILIAVSHYRKQNSIKKLLDDFQDVANIYHFMPTHKEMLGSRVIGLNEATHQLLFMSASKGKHDGYLIDLREIKSARVRKEYATRNAYAKYRWNMEPFVEKIVLLLEYKDGTPPLALPFYDKAKDRYFERLELSEKAYEWQSRISAVLEGGDKSVEENAPEVLHQAELYLGLDASN